MKPIYVKEAVVPSCDYAYEVAVVGSAPPCRSMADPKLVRAYVMSLLETLPWVSRTGRRDECFMVDGPVVEYTYGKAPHERSYLSVPMHPFIRLIQDAVNEELKEVQYDFERAAGRELEEDLPAWGPMTGCFLNRYATDQNGLQWHADDSPIMDHTKAIVVVSFGEEREIHWRPNGTRGETPPERRQVLGWGSMFVMPPGFQHIAQHQVPKGSRPMGPRVSLTFRAFQLQISARPTGG